MPETVKEIGEAETWLQQQYPEATQDARDSSATANTYFSDTHSQLQLRLAQLHDIHTQVYHNYYTKENCQ